MSATQAGLSLPSTPIVTRVTMRAASDPLLILRVVGRVVGECVDSGLVDREPICRANFLPDDRFELGRAVNGFRVLLRNASAVVGGYLNVIKTRPARWSSPGRAEETSQEMGATVEAIEAKHVDAAACATRAQCRGDRAGPDGRVEGAPGPLEMTFATSGGRV